MARPSSECSPTSSPKTNFTSSPKSNFHASLKKTSITVPENPWDWFYLLENQPRRGEAVWDPWPVKRFNANCVFKAAQALVEQRNEENVDNLIDRVVLLPASGSIEGIHGGSAGTDLYSIRSPRKLPVRIHLWMTVQGKVMVRKNSLTSSLRQLLKTFDNSTWDGNFKYYEFWRSISLGQKDLIQLRIPDHLHQAVYERWWTVNVFRFLDLPAELRNMIISFATCKTAEPYAHVYRPKDFHPLPKPNTNLLLVNRQLRHEAMHILLKQVTFTFRKHGQLLRFFEQISKEDRLALQSLELVFDQESLLDFFGAQVFRHSPKPGFSSADFYFKTTLFTERIGLKHLRIYFPHPREKRKCKKLRYLCRRTISLWIWAAARKFLRDIPNVEFTGYIDEDLKKDWLETLALERKGILTDPMEIEVWQRRTWDNE